MWIDPNVDRKNKLIFSHRTIHDFQQSVVPLFSIFELSITGLCNRKCVFCPRVDPEIYPNKAEYMSLSLYEKLMTELGGLSYSGIVIYSGFSEPLLNKQLPLFLQIARRACPTVRLEVITNGDFLTPDKIRDLYESGMSSLHISMYDGPKQVEHFRKMQQQSGVPEQIVFLRERWQQEEGYKLTLSNRAGTVNLESLNVESLKEPLRQNCYYPFYFMMVDHNGDVLLCSHDWGKKLILGNLGANSILDIWNSQAMNDIRGKLGNRDRSLAPCNRCDVIGTLIGKDHFEMWKKCYQQHAKL